MFPFFCLLPLLPTCPTCIVQLVASLCGTTPSFPILCRLFSSSSLFYFILLGLVGLERLDQRVWQTYQSRRDVCLAIVGFILNDPSSLSSYRPPHSSEIDTDIPLGISFCFCPFILVRMILLQTFYLYSTHSHTFMNVKDDISFISFFFIIVIPPSYRTLISFDVFEKDSEMSQMNVQYFYYTRESSSYIVLSSRSEG